MQRIEDRKGLDELLIRPVEEEGTTVTDAPRPRSAPFTEDQEANSFASFLATTAGGQGVSR